LPGGAGRDHDNEDVAGGADDDHGARNDDRGA
jgi:hypothetical protein